MRSKKRGVWTAILTVIALIIFNLITMIVGLVVSNGGWATIGFVILALIITAIVIVVEFVYGLVQYKKYNNDYGLGIVQSLLVMVGIFIVSIVLFTLFGMSTF